MEEDDVRMKEEAEVQHPNPHHIRNFHLSPIPNTVGETQTEQRQSVERPPADIGYSSLRFHLEKGGKK